MKLQRIACLLLITMMFASCSKKEEITFNQRNAVEEKEDGWIYLYYCEFDKNKEDNINNPSYFFGGYNLKYKKLEEYSIKSLNEKTGKVEVEASASIPALLHNEKYVKELDQINELLNQKKFTSSINVEDISVKLNDFKKEDIVQLHNKAMESGNATEGKYLSLPEADIIQEENVIDGYRWQIGYLILYGEIKKTDIELIYSDGTYLCDKVTKGTATNEETTIYNEIQSLETKIVEDQKFNAVSDKELSNKGVDGKRLSKILSTLDEQ